MISFKPAAEIMGRMPTACLHFFSKAGRAKPFWVPHALLCQGPFKGREGRMGGSGGREPSALGRSGDGGAGCWGGKAPLK